MRVYLPATVPLVRQWLHTGQAPPMAAAAVTPALREWYREGTEEEMEYAAQLLAARAALDLLDADPDAPRRRVIVAADVADLDVASAGLEQRGSVTVGVPVPVSAWASALVDGEDAEAAVSAAVTVLGVAEAGDDDATFLIDEAASYELSWYAVQELDFVLDLLDT